MSKGTTIKDAIARFEEKHECKASEATHVIMYQQLPPIEKMDASLSTLVKCEHLSLSTNCIEKIANLNGLKNLKILSLARNNIKSLTGLEAVGDTLEQLWISYNRVEKLKGINVLKKLKVLYMSNNDVKDMNEVAKLDDLPCLVELVLTGNPIHDSFGGDDAAYKAKIQEKLKKLKKLDGVPLVDSNQTEDD